MVRIIYAAGRFFKPFASGVRAPYAAGHFFEPLAFGVRPL